MGARNKFKLTKIELDKLAKLGRPIDPLTLEMLELVLVNGESQAVVSKRYGKAQQFLSERVKNMYQRMASQAGIVPKGCVVRMVTVHQDDVVALNAFQESSLARAMA